MEGNRASVVYLKGHGEQRLRTAIMQGLVREEIKDCVDEVLAQNEAMKAEKDVLIAKNSQLERELERYSRVYKNAMAEFNRAQKRKRKRNDAAACVAIFTFLVSAVFVGCSIFKALFG